MNFGIVILFGLILLKLVYAQTDELSSSNKYCTIRSQQYPDEYLYSSKDQIASSFKIKVFVNRANERYLKTIDQIGWVLAPITDDTFNIISLKYKEILCQMDDSKKVNTYRLDTEDDILKTSPKCIWKISQIDYDGIDYMIKNVYSGQELTAAADLMKTGKLFRRNVYTLVSSESVSKESHWSMECFEDFEDLMKSITKF